MGNIINRVFDSSGPEGKVRGTPQQIIDKYNQLARDAQLSGDRVATENFQQHAEHYLRLLSVAQKEQEVRREEQERQNRERQAERDRERVEARAQRNLARAQERLQRNRELAEVRRFKGGEDLKGILKKLEELDVELDDDTMAQLHEHLAQLGDHMHGMDFTFEMPNIEFVPGEGGGEDIVVIEGAPDARFFRRDGNNIQFAPKSKTKSFTFPGGQGGDVFFERNSETSDRLDALEERMERIERMLEKIAERID